MMKSYMKNTKLILLFTTVLIVCSGNVFSQDFHLSQYNMATLYLNPSLTGNYWKENSRYRFYADYRTQWKAITGKPYNTSYLAFDKSYQKYGLGGYFINNHSGSGGFNTLNFMLSGAYHIINEANNPHLLSVGLQIGVINKSFDPNNFTFDNQYDGQSPGGFDNNLPSNEIFDKTSITSFDANFGIYYRRKEKNSSVHPFIGFSIYHVTMPNESFNEETYRLPMRFNLQGGADFIINKELTLTANALYMTQAKANELNLGLLVKYKIKDTGYKTLIGLGYRNKDAIIAQAGLIHNGHTFKISYDINTSELNAYSKNRGAMEFSLIISVAKKSKLIIF